jgi:hypothetical protein
MIFSSPIISKDVLHHLVCFILLNGKVKIVDGGDNDV